MWAAARAPSTSCTATSTRVSCRVRRSESNCILSRFFAHFQQQSLGAALRQRHAAIDLGGRGLGAGVLGDELDAQGGAHLGGNGQMPAVRSTVLLEYPGHDRQATDR